MNGIKFLLGLGSLLTLAACDPAAAEGEVFTAAEFGAVEIFDAENFGIERSGVVELAQSCVQPEEYWAEHSGYDGADSRWPVSERMSACGSTIYDWMQNDSDDPYAVLAKAWIAAHLNAADGAAMPLDVSTTYSRAGDVLETCEIEDVDTAFAMASILTEYNDGDRGVEACDGSLALAL